MRTIEQMISQEVHYCCSSLINTLANVYGSIETCTRNEPGQDAIDLAGQAFELATPVDDWQSAAREEIDTWDRDDIEAELTARAFEFDANASVKMLRSTLGNVVCNDDYDAQQFCEENDIDPYQIEIFEHWIVSDWLADKLVEQGEKVDKDFAGLTVWARTTTGQAIYADAVIEAIYAATHTA